MGKKSRKKDKAPKSPKGIEDREKEIRTIKEKLDNSGLGEDLSRITNIFDIMDEFVNTGVSSTGSIKLEGYDRTLDYVFTSNPNTISWMNIRYTGNIKS